MNLTQLRAVVGGMLSLAALVVACNKTKPQDSIVGPQLGESTAAAPANPSAPPPDAGGATGVSASISGTPSGAVAAPATGSAPNTAADGANSGTTAAPEAPAGQPSGTTLPQDNRQALPQDRGTTLPQDRTAPPAQPQPNVTTPPPAPR